MKIFAVGGSVRDELLGRSPEDRDYVVLDASEGELLARGLIKVGLSFPIYLDRETGDEYTLAENLETDLARRDLTINALAKSEDGTIIDLFDGLADLERRIFRHVKRENFFEDPLRVLRVARFSAQLPEFHIHDETLSLLKEVDCKNILPERIIKELRKVLLSEDPSRFFDLLKGKGIFPENVCRLSKGSDEKQQFAKLVTKLSLTELDTLRDRLGIQNDWMDAARAWIMLQTMTDEIEYFYAIDAFRKPWLVDPSLQAKFDRVKDIGIRDIEPGLKGPAISEAIKAERIKALRS